MTGRRVPILLLGGTGEANTLATALVERFGDDIVLTSSMAGRTDERGPVAGLVRVGGFGGIDGLTSYLRDTATALVIDATHPFASQISQHAIAASGALGLPLLRLERPSWQPQPGDRWIAVSDMAAAATALAPVARRIWLTTGTAELSALSGLTDAWFLIRTITPPPVPLPLARYELLQARGPFEVAGERDIIRRYRIDTLVTKASGGNATEAKLIAAREAGISVIMIARPILPPAETVPDTAAALAWVATSLNRLR